MSPRTAQQNELIRNQKREQIMQAALQVFSEKGFHSTSMSTVAKAAKVSKGLSYSYFESKDSLLKAILLQGFEHLDILEEKFPNGLHTREEMISMLDYYIQAVQNNPTYWKLYFSLLMQVDLHAILGSRMEELMGNVLQQLANYFQKKGEEDPMGLAMLLGATLDGLFMNYCLNPELFDLPQAKQHIIKRFL